MHWDETTFCYHTVDLLFNLFFDCIRHGTGHMGDGCGSLFEYLFGNIYRRFLPALDFSCSGINFHFSITLFSFTTEYSGLGLSLSLPCLTSYCLVCSSLATFTLNCLTTSLINIRLFGIIPLNIHRQFDIGFMDTDILPLDSWTLDIMTLGFWSSPLLTLYLQTLNTLLLNSQISNILTPDS
jgi:hypothetical protein